MRQKRVKCPRPDSPLFTGLRNSDVRLLVLFALPPYDMARLLVADRSMAEFARCPAVLARMQGYWRYWAKQEYGGLPDVLPSRFCWRVRFKRWHLIAGQIRVQPFAENRTPGDDMRCQPGIFAIRSDARISVYRMEVVPRCPPVSGTRVTFPLMGTLDITRRGALDAYWSVSYTGKSIGIGSGGEPMTYTLNAGTYTRDEGSDHDSSDSDSSASDSSDDDDRPDSADNEWAAARSGLHGPDVIGFCPARGLQAHCTLDARDDEAWALSIVNDSTDTILEWANQRHAALECTVARFIFNSSHTASATKCALAVAIYWHNAYMHVYHTRADGRLCRDTVELSGFDSGSSTLPVFGMLRDNVMYSPLTERVIVLPPCQHK